MSENDEAIARREAAARLRTKALKMRREGASLDSISTRLGISRANARKMVARELRSLSAEADAEERRMLHVEVLMDLWRSLYPAAASGDPAAVDRFLHVEERLSRLQGLDLADGAGGDGGGARRPRPADDRFEALEGVGELD